MQASVTPCRPAAAPFGGPAGEWRLCLPQPTCRPTQTRSGLKGLHTRGRLAPLLLQAPAAAASVACPPPPQLAETPSSQSPPHRLRPQRPRGGRPWPCCLLARRCWPRPRPRRRRPLRQPRRSATAATGRPPDWARPWIPPSPSERACHAACRGAPAVLQKERPQLHLGAAGGSRMPRVQGPSRLPATSPPLHLPLPARFFKTPSGVRVQVLAEGSSSGPAAAAGDPVLVDFVLR